jgi:hypothetical protein
VTDHYQRSTSVAEHVVAVIEDLRADRLSIDQVNELDEAIYARWLLHHA